MNEDNGWEGHDLVWAADYLEAEAILQALRYGAVAQEKVERLQAVARQLKALAVVLP